MERERERLGWRDRGRLGWRERGRLGWRERGERSTDVLRTELLCPSVYRPLLNYPSVRLTCYALPSLSLSLSLSLSSLSPSLSSLSLSSLSRSLHSPYLLCVFLSLSPRLSLSSSLSP